MKKSVILIPIIFAVAGTSFVSYSFLDTFIIPKNTRKVNIANNISAFFDISSSPLIGSQSGQSSQSSQEVSPASKDGYYEDLTDAQIAALFKPTKEFREREYYSDPDIYINITTHRDAANTTTYYVADVRIKHLSFFRTALAKDTFGENVEERPSDICKKNKGILAINGDYYGAQEAGYVLRNGVSLRDTVSNEIGGHNPRNNPEDLAIYADGTFEVFNEKEHTLKEIADKRAWQVFSFGPGLVKNGEIAVTEKSEVDSIIRNGTSLKSQRTAMGIIAPLHYCFVVNDGRTDESEGFSLYEMATIMKDLHCYCAYNLDGGGSSVMYLDDGTGNANKLGHLVNKPNQNYNGRGNSSTQQRGISDIVYFGKDN